MNKKVLSIVIATILLLSCFATALAQLQNNKVLTESQAPSSETISETMSVASNRYTMPEQNISNIANHLNLKGYNKIMSNQRLEVWHRDENASIRIVDKSSGYIWGGLPSEKPEDMNTMWSGVGNSLLTIDYFDKKGIERKTSIADKQVEKSYTLNGNSLKYLVNFKELGISFDFTMVLEEDSIRFNLDYNSIKESGTYSLAAVYFMPFLGSTRQDEINGYIFVPDGPGALIRFGKPFKYLINFDKRIYGKDYGIDKLYEVNDLKATRPNDFMTEEPSILMPVFGIVQGVKQNAIFAYVTDGAEYASITATTSGILTNYNWASAKFIYRQKYLQPTSRSGAGVQVVQKDKNVFNASITYYFLTGDKADYVGMADLYKNILKAQGLLNKNERKDSSIPLELDILGSDIERGFIFNNVLKITGIDQTKSLAEYLTSNGIKNISLVMKGWQKGGINGSKPSAFSFEPSLGTKNDFMILSHYISGNGGRFYYYENPVTATEYQLDLGNEAGHSLSQALIDVERDNPNIWLKDTYYIKANLVAKYINDKVKLYNQNNMPNMALDMVGSKLYAENQRGNVLTRSQALKAFSESIKNCNDQLDNLALYRPNQYLWEYANEMFNVPMVNSQYLFETDTVPFMQMVLKGNVDYYAPYINMGFYSQTDILRLIEYGAYPAFILSGVPNNELKYTNLTDLYSTYYKDWIDNIISSYKEINTALSAVEGMHMINREVLQIGIVKVDYDGGVSIIINYTNDNYNYLDNIVVPSLGYSVIKGR